MTASVFLSFRSINPEDFLAKILKFKSLNEINHQILNSTFHQPRGYFLNHNVFNSP